METDLDKIPSTDGELVKALRNCASNFSCGWSDFVSCAPGWKAVLDRAADRLEILSDEARL